MIEITSRTNPRIKQLVKLRNGRKRRAAGVVLAEGVREVTRAIQAGLLMREVYICERCLDQDETVKGVVMELVEAADEKVQKFALSVEVMEKVCYVDSPEGVLAVLDAPNWGLDKMTEMVEAEKDDEGEDITASGGYGDEKKVFLVCVQMEKPGNVGAMVRTAASAGIDGVIAANAEGYPVDVFHPNAIRTSTAAVFDLPTVSAGEDEVLKWLTEHKIKLLAATPAGAVDYREADYVTGLVGGGGIAIVIGPEDRGLPNQWLEATDQNEGQRVVIPNKSKIVDSLNASNAAAVLMYEAMRQRGM
ncbi:RNA methyltransferase [Planctomycetota bacterium]|nr:RNA methyltransferase [Planctomycetota bacterium]